MTAWRSPFDPPLDLEEAHERLGAKLPSRRHTGPEGERHPYGSPPLCRECGETNPDKFYQGWMALCGKCRRARAKRLRDTDSGEG